MIEFLSGSIFTWGWYHKLLHSNSVIALKSSLDFWKEISPVSCSYKFTLQHSSHSFLSFKIENMLWTLTTRKNAITAGFRKVYQTKSSWTKWTSGNDEKFETTISSNSWRNTRWKYHDTMLYRQEYGNQFIFRTISGRLYPKSSGPFSYLVKPSMSYEYTWRISMSIWFYN